MAIGIKNMRLNLGCGYRKSSEPDVINVDSDPRCNPDELVNLEIFNWPWRDNSVDGILLCHTLEHLGAETRTFLKIMRELYRILVPGGFVEIYVPHPRCDAFIDSPTHVRVITEETLKLFCQAINQICINNGLANETLGMQLDIDFDIVFSKYILLDPWKSQFENKEIDEPQLNRAIKSYNNVIEELQFVLKKVSPPGHALEERIKYGTVDLMGS